MFPGRNEVNLKLPKLMHGAKLTYQLLYL